MEVDVAVIGAGTAGLRAWREARARTPRVALIDEGPGGTTCARVGCMPSKLLIAAADAAHGAAEAGGFGVHAGPIRVDGRAVMARVRAERDRFTGFVTRDVEAFPEELRVRGRARLDGPNRVIVGDRVIHTRSIVVATGSRPIVPPNLRALGDRLAVNDDVFDWEDLPASLVVFGPGIIGLELGQALRRLGVRVRVFGLSGSVGPFVDPVIREEARRLFGAEFPLDPDVRGLEVRRVDDGVEVTFDAADGPRTERFERALCAVGRAPNVDGLGLESLGQPLGRFGLPPWDRETLQIGDLPVFLAGDVTGERALLHEATDEGTIAGRSAASWPDVSAGARRVPLAIAFTDPQMLTVGVSGDRLPSDAITGVVSFEDQGRSRVMRQNRGRLHVYAAADGRLLGAEGIGPRLEHLGHLLAWVVQLGLTADEALNFPFYHPVVEEGLRTALRDVSAQVTSRRVANDVATVRE
jgi:dihydrolipoamide dehydrogenase